MPLFLSIGGDNVYEHPRDTPVAVAVVRENVADAIPEREEEFVIDTHAHTRVSAHTHTRARASRRSKSIPPALLHRRIGEKREREGEREGQRKIESGEIIPFKR